VSEVKVDRRRLGLPKEEWVEVPAEGIGEFCIAGAVRKNKWGEREKRTSNFGFASCNAREISREGGNSVSWSII
jgi:hypothetical protein